MILVIGLLVLATGQESPLTINNPDPKFRMTLPSGYAQVPPPSGVHYSYRRLLEGSTGIGVNVVVLNGRIDPERLKEAEVRAGALKQLPSGAQVRLGTSVWSEHELDVIESEFTMQGVDLLTLIVQVPILPRAVQVSIAAPKSSEAQARQDLKALLRSFRGTTHWLTPRQRGMAFAAGGTAVLGWSMLVLYAVAYAILFNKHPLRAWRIRVGYLSVNVVVLGLAGLMGVLYEISKGKTPMDASFYVQVFAAVIIATRTTQLAQKGKAAEQPQAPAPAP